MNIVQVYAPTSEKQDDIVEQSDIMKLTKKGELNIIIGDFNAKVGVGAKGDVVGGFGLGIRNLRGDRLVQFCTEQQLAIVNTFFKQPPRRLYTWRSPADCDEHLISNQIDFIMINKEHKKAVKSVKTYPGADVNSDHNPVVMNLKVRRFIHAIPSKTPKRIDIKQLKEPLKKAITSHTLERKLQTNIELGAPVSEVEEKWKIVRNALLQTQTEDIGFNNHI